jgi:hypothetical protein
LNLTGLGEPWGLISYSTTIMGLDQWMRTRTILAAGNRFGKYADIYEIASENRITNLIK